MRSASIGVTIVSVAPSNKEGISVVLEPHPVVRNGGRGSRDVVYSGRSDRPVGFRLRPEFRCSPCLLRLTLSISLCSARQPGLGLIRGVLPKGSSLSACGLHSPHYRRGGYRGG